MYINLKPQFFFKTLVIIIILLLIANIFSIATKLNFILDYDNQKIVRGISDKFDFDTEKSIPTMFSSIILFFSAVLLGILGIKDRKDRAKYSPWFGLSAIFVFLSIDEMIEIHEHLIPIIKMIKPTSGVFYYAWIIPYGIGLIILSLVYYKFLMRLPKKTLYLFMLSGFIFILGAVVIESFEGWEHQLNGKRTLTFCLMYTAEETLEMLGVSLFIYAILSYSSFSVKIESKTSI
ncbi:peptidase M48 Ste24p [Confluentibacter citreus]|uniref:peptidase M48 Ste24p n=1 Tax=Confluentibacter citreus TaxID=2007307 RepID=UPI000C288BEE|nr:peptidase M48 Ste24p [Confluentibacter citreus]